ncbi:DUF115 domain-containing protein [Marivivens donghaensis]|uniref:DUF115 domain-containing protein n=1 Tax=Marivivens donghaensis TaxID=1699413 RepID=A0ABX0W3W9_9RHOB|nr:6-hydroxymethylpterin diphosphokinase MptE-like protein [Marivivens donghaensis]NIY73632.1 DUF115 domain-containing protein [Marivivens donghaensis]
MNRAELLSKSPEELEVIYDEALKRLPSRAPIYLPTERVGMVDRITGVEHVRKIYKEDLDEKYRPRLRELREQFKGKDRCFLIGNGPSLNRTDLSVLKDEVTFAVNGFFLKARELDWKPTFYLVEDHLVAEDRAYWVNDFKGPIKMFPAYLGYVFPESEDTIFYNHRPRKSYPHGFDFSMEADKITYTGCTVTFSMMQIAAFLGFKEIYLIGVDASYDIPKDAQEGKDYSVGVLDMKSDDPNHFDPNYFGKGFRWHDPQVEMMVAAYEEARRTLEGTPQTIYNATVGGMLEVFERRSFHDIFPNAKLPDDVEKAKEKQNAKKYPKLLVLDMTAMGNGTATGDLKATLFDGWSKDRIMQVAKVGENGFGIVVPNEESGYDTTTVAADEAKSAIEEFAPDIVLYRPVPKTPALHEFAMDVIGASTAPIVTWIMDDWPAELQTKPTENSEELCNDFADLLNAAALNLSICDKMSTAFEARYGVKFHAFANGVNPVQWPAMKHHHGQQLKLRYSGNLAANMTLDSVLTVAKAVEKLGQAGHDITFEISTQPWWHRDSAHLFADLKQTTIDTIARDAEAYREWLAGADAVLLTYNFDEETLRYVQYSMANKMPECLASGAAILAYGPKEVATIDYLSKSGGAITVDEQSPAKVEEALLRLLGSAELRNSLGQTARDVAFRNHNVVDLRDKLRELIADAAWKNVPSVEGLNVETLLESTQPDAKTLLTVMASDLLLSPEKALNIVQMPSAWATKIKSAQQGLPNESLVAKHYRDALSYAKSRQSR